MKNVGGKKMKKEPFEKNMLRGLDEKRYVKKIESIIIEAGRRLLNSLRVNHTVIPTKHIIKFLEKHPEFKNTTWHQIGFKRLYGDKLINNFQYKLLITMKQILNKNDSYILRATEFDDRKYALGCERFQKGETCHQHSCVSIRVCPFFYKNTEEWAAKAKTKMENHIKMVHPKKLSNSKEQEILKKITDVAIKHRLGIPPFDKRDGVEND